MTKSILYSFAVIAMLAFTGPTAAGEVGLHVVFSDGEASIIRGYYSDQSAPQMGKKKNNKGLPPGIAKNLQQDRWKLIHVHIPGNGAAAKTQLSCGLIIMNTARATISRPVSCRP